MTTYSYDSQKGNLIIDGMAVTGFAEDKKVTMEYEEDFIEPHIDVDGNPTVAEKNDRSAIVTVPLNQTSPWIKTLHQYAAEKKGFPISWEDFNDNAVGFSGEYARVMKAPPVDAGNAIEDFDVEIWVGRAIVK